MSHQVGEMSTLATHVHKFDSMKENQVYNFKLHKTKGTISIHVDQLQSQGKPKEK